MVLSKEDFDNCLEKSFFTDRNIATNLSPARLSSNMIPCDKLNEFHFQVSFFLNFFSALLLEIDKKNATDLYDINKYNEIYNELNIKFDITKSFNSGTENDGNTKKLSEEINSIDKTTNPITPSKFTFYVNTFLNFSNVPLRILSSCWEL